ncbi:MAG: hypothetical protein KGP29_04470 [Proteobacteria bacterium]|nr:hypothetical protein [Pseudomonadota bacterium]
MRKFTFENRVLIACCSAIFLLSIFLRSLIDIGPDTGIYLSLGKKVADGKKYYYDFFESNFPISFYFYALEYRLSALLHIDPIITSEIIINLLALVSISWSAKILARSEVHQNKAHYNLIIIGFCLGFFLRPNALQMGEFGTKTSFILLLLFPYISYSFPRRSDFTKKDLIARGCLIGLMPCFKSHYIIFPLVIELYKFWQKKSVRFFLELDKLIAALIYVSYLIWMLKFMPEFFEMIVPMWMKIYGSYDSNDIFLGNFLRLIAAHIGPFAFSFLVFSRLKPDKNDKILLLFFCAAVLLFILENAMTIDQSVIFYSVTTICVLKFTFDLIVSKKIIFSENKFILISLFFLPIFDLSIFPSAIFGLTGFNNVWWLIAPIILIRYPRFLLVYFLFLAAAIMIIKHCGYWSYIAFNIFALFGILFFYEKKIHAKFSQKFSVFSVFLISASLSSLIYLYVSSAFETLTRKSEYSFPNEVSNMINYYSKEFAPSREDSLLMVSSGNGFNFPRLNYLKKENYQKFHSASIQASSLHNKSMFDISDLDGVFVGYYLFDDIRKVLKNPRTKVIFFNNSHNVLSQRNRCLITSLEYYLLDQDFRKFFLENFRFTNRVIINHEVEVIKNIPLITGIKPSAFDQITKSKKQVLHDFEIYVRK